MPWARSIALSLSRFYPPSIEPDELVSLAYMGLMRAASTFDFSRGVEFQRFARAVVSGAVLNGFRRSRYRDAMAAELPSHAIDPSPTPDSIVEAAEVRELLCSWLAMLPEREREVLILLYFDQATMADIAAEWGYHPSRISQWHQSGLRQLRECVRRAGIRGNEVLR